MLVAAAVSASAAHRHGGMFALSPVCSGRNALRPLTFVHVSLLYTMHHPLHLESVTCIPMPERHLMSGIGSARFHQAKTCAMHSKHLSHMPSPLIQ